MLTYVYRIVPSAIQTGLELDSHTAVLTYVYRMGSRVVATVHVNRNCFWAVEPLAVYAEPSSVGTAPDPVTHPYGGSALFRTSLAAGLRSSVSLEQRCNLELTSRSVCWDL